MFYILLILLYPISLCLLYLLYTRILFINLRFINLLLTYLPLDL